MNKQKKIIIILFVLTIVFTILGATFAYWNWQSTNAQRTAVTFTAESGFSCGADGGETLTNQQKILMPTTSCTNETYAYQQEIKTSVTNNRSGSIYMDLWLDIKNIGEGLSDSPYFRYALTSQANDCEHNILSEGTFTGSVNGDKINLLEGTQYQTSGSNTYYLYIWIDSEETNPDILNQPFNISLGGQCSDNYVPKPNKPVLDTGMIPVTISDTGVVTTVFPNDGSWYDYDNKQWANAVLVKETGTKTRTANKVAGTTINPNDILAYFVWIPRYSYKVWQYEGVAATVPNPPPSIDIKFVKSNVKEVATGVDQYYTHPAFTFGDKELDGIWVGKFETSTDKTDTCYTTPNATNCNNTNQSPRIVPTVDSLRYQDVSNEFQTALKFAGGSMTNNVVLFEGSTFYGLTTATDSHMMKNSEWGAVAYLSHSKYGINTEIRKNNFEESSSNKYRTSTGCGADVANANTSTVVTTCAIPYGTPSNETYTYPQSTTGNISGIFDMSGGAYEFVMGNYGNTTGSSGFVAAWFTNNSKYYNLYDSSIFTGTNMNNFTFCTLATCGGHALNETKSWYSDYAYFVTSSGPWLFRGGFAGNIKNAGTFYASDHSGASSYNGSHSFRGVLVASGA